MFKKVLFTLLAMATLSTATFAQNKPTLIFYCGITMVKPMMEISKIIEKKHNCTIKIIQGGSKDLYDALALSKKGDLYLPGSDSYRKKHLKEGLLLDGEYIGFNKAAIFVQKGNPKNIKNLTSLIDENIATIICDPKSGSIGKMSKKVITKFKDAAFYNDVFDAAVEVGTDSRNLNKAIIDRRVDMTVNWRATGFWGENRIKIDVIDIDDKISPKKKLVLNLLSFSKNKKIAKDLMKFSSSKQGQEIMKRYGFL